MTDISSTLTTHPGSQIPPVPTLVSPISAAPDALALSAQDEDEPYTIKCICNYDEDDGNTVLCEKCQTWQHIECFYPDGEVPEVHNCADCEPRSLDPKGAAERQRRRRDQVDTGTRRAKRPPSKSHKKKSKETHSGSTPVNGWSGSERKDPSGYDRNSDSPRAQPPPAKRPKTSHRSSNSVSSQAASPSLAQYGSHKRSGSDPHLARSPMDSPLKQIPYEYRGEPFTPGFMRLYRDDAGDVSMHANLFNNIRVTDSLTSWISNPEALANATDGKAPQQVFQRLDQPIESLPLPPIIVRSKEDRSVEYFGEHPYWQYLTVESMIPKGGIIGELKGEIGHLHDYCQDPSNRWHALQHPEPFVFFHPQLPIYIDTRKEGTTVRYVRRSCRPNLVMKTLITNGNEYNFCFCADIDLSPGSEVTIGWELNDTIRSYLDRACFGPQKHSGVKTEGLTEVESEYVCNWVERVLAEFGGCACSGPQACYFDRFDRRDSLPSVDSGIQMSNGTRPKKARRGTNPTSRNGRAPSDHRDLEDDHDDGRSTSGSAKSKPRSRDMTPLTAVYDGGMSTGVGVELSDREKRKIAMVERTFEQLEHDNMHHAQRKKKRSSAGSVATTPAVGTSKQNVTRTTPSVPNTPGYSTKSYGYMDVGTGGSPPEMSPRSPRDKGKASSPSVSTPLARSPLPQSVQTMAQERRPTYVDASMQTVPESEAWYDHLSPSVPSPTRTSGMSLKKRLLSRFHDDRVRSEGQTLTQTSPVPTTNQNVPRNSHPSGVSDDVPMEDVEVPPSSSPRPDRALPQQLDSETGVAAQPELPSGKQEAMIKPPLPSSNSERPVNGFRSADLRVQLPPTPQFSNESTSSSVAGTPVSTLPISQSPSSLISHIMAFSPSVANSVQPSPVKKKLSLSDYRNRRSKVETPSAEKTQDVTASSSKPTSSLLEDVKMHGVEESAVVDTPASEKPPPPLASVSEAPGQT